MFDTNIFLCRERNKGNTEPCVFFFFFCIAGNVFSLALTLLGCGMGGGWVGYLYTLGCRSIPAERSNICFLRGSQRFSRTRQILVVLRELCVDLRYTLAGSGSGFWPLNSQHTSLLFFWTIREEAWLEASRRLFINHAGHQEIHPILPCSGCTGAILFLHWLHLSPWSHPSSPAPPTPTPHRPLPVIAVFHLPTLFFF